MGKLTGYDGLDILTEGKFIVAPGSTHPETFLDYEPDGDIRAVRMAPDRLLELLERPGRGERTSEPGVIDPEELAVLLKALDPRNYGQGKYAEWIALGAACHDATNGHGLSEWLEWCADDPDYGYAAAMERAECTWGSFEAGRSGGATYRTLFRAVRLAGRADLVEPIEARLRAMSAIDDFKSDPLDLDAATTPEPLDLDCASKRRIPTLANDPYAQLFSLTATQRGLLFDKDGEPRLLAKLYETDRARYEDLLTYFRTIRMPEVQKLERHVEKLIRAAQKAAKKAKPGEGFAGFELGDTGKVLPTQRNVRLAIERLDARLSYDEFADLVKVEGIGQRLDGAVNDAAMGRLYLRVDEEYGLRLQDGFFLKIVADIARQNSFHPVKDYLAGLAWDGTPRIDRWLIDYCGAEDNAFNRGVSRMVLVAGVRRIKRPGCKFDTLLVLESEEGLNKSTMLERLARRPQWFTDSAVLGADDKKMIESCSGKWLVEIAELSGMSRAEVERVKAQLSRTTDRARLSYARFPVEVPRAFIAVGATNKAKYLASLTGNRRFWPVSVTKIDLERFTRDVDQLWAEAVAVEPDHSNLFLPEALWKAAAEVQAERELDNEYTDRLGAMLGAAEGFVFQFDLWRALGVATQRITPTDQEKLTRAMKALGFAKARNSLNGHKATSWRRGAIKQRLHAREPSFFSKDWHFSALDGEEFETELPVEGTI